MCKTGREKNARSISPVSFRTLALVALMLAFLVVLTGRQAAAKELEALYQNPETGYAVYISDSQDLLSEEEEEVLLQDMIPVTAYGNAAFDSAYPSGLSPRGYAEQEYSGYFKESGTLFLIDMYNREIWLYSSGAVENIVTPSYANSITDNIYRYASNGQYYRCASEAFRQELVLLDGGKITQPMRKISAALLALILALLINYLFIRFTTKNYKAREDALIAAIAVAAAISAAPIVVTSRKKIEKSGGGGGGSFGGGGGGGGGGGFSGGGHKF